MNIFLVKALKVIFLSTIWIFLHRPRLHKQFSVNLQHGQESGTLNRAATLHRNPLCYEHIMIIIPYRSEFSWEFNLATREFLNFKMVQIKVYSNALIVATFSF